MSFKGVLHPYQEEATSRFLNRKSLLLAYGCGTGKTVMAIAAAERLLNSGEINQVLILCPASLKYQWKKKIIEFTNADSVIVVDGDKATRTVQLTQNMNSQYIIASYESLIYDYENMSLLKPGCVICDEASAIKSFKAMRSKRVKKLFGKTAYRLGLTATPIENRPEELYSIMQWVDGTVLGRYDLFEKAYIKRNNRGWVVEYKNLDVLRGRMGDALARKTRHDPEVRPYLPDVDEDNWEVHFDSDTYKVYKHIAKDMLSHIEENPSLYGGKEDLRFGFEEGMNESSPDGRLMAMYMCMEMLLNHPELIAWSAREYEKDSPEGSAYASTLMKSGVMHDVLKSGKAPKVDYLLNEIQKLKSDPDSKIIIISKYKYMLRLLSYAIPYATVIFNGDMSAKEKALAVEVFSQPGNDILLTSYAGGYGLDLYMADVLINFDLPWSAGTRDQINSRHVRASSEFVKVYVRNMITVGSVEERKLRILHRKGQLISSVIDGDGVDSVEVGGDHLRTHLEKVLK